MSYGSRLGAGQRRCRGDVIDTLLFLGCALMILRYRWVNKIAVGPPSLGVRFRDDIHHIYSGALRSKLTAWLIDQ